VTRVIPEINRNAKGRAAVAFSNGASKIRIIPARRPNIRKLIIITEVRIL
jgi:hypothetical protein